MGVGFFHGILHLLKIEGYQKPLLIPYYQKVLPQIQTFINPILPKSSSPTPIAQVHILLNPPMILVVRLTLTFHGRKGLPIASMILAWQLDLLKWSPPTFSCNLLYILSNGYVLLSQNAPMLPLLFEIGMEHFKFFHTPSL